jgi:Carbohydrate binding module 27.
MKTKKLKKILATAMAISTATTILPMSQIAIADTNNESNGVYYCENFSDVYGGAVPNNSIYENDFENNQLPDEMNNVTTTSAVSIAENNSAMMFQSHFDGTGDWSNNMHGFSFNANYSESIPRGSTIKFDLLIPTANKQFSGIIKCTGALKDSSYGWKGAAVKDVESNDFVDLGNGYSSKTISIEVNEDVNGLKQVITQITGYNCDYLGNMYIDNIKIVKNEGSNNSDIPSVEPIQWNFDSDANGWSYGGQWAYNGPTDNVVNYDASTTGSGALKLSLDYSKDSSASWSEFKVNKDLGVTTSFNGYNVLTYDFIYDPSKMTTGKFQTKFSIGDSLSATGEIDLNNSENIGEGLKKAQVKIQFVPKNVEVNSITFGIVGSNTDYKGDIYIDNIKFNKEQVVDGYVAKTATTVDKLKLSLMI